MPSRSRDLGAALKNRVVVAERPHIAETPGERAMPQAKMLAVSRVRPNPEQPRKHFDPEGMEELAASIRERGIMQPLVVRPGGDGYLIVMGERRYRAAILAGLDEVPAIVRDATDEQAYLDALIENLQRANLTDEEEAEAYRGLLARGYSARRIADRLGIAPSRVSRVARIYQDPVLAEAVIEGRITKSQAQELLVAPEEEKPRLVQFIAGRRKKAEPVRLEDLRDRVEQAREGVALRNTSAHNSECGMPTETHEGGAPGAGSRVLDASSSRAIPQPGVSEGPEIEAIRMRAREVRRVVEEQLIPAIGDPDIAAELAGIRSALDGVLPTPKM